MKPQDELDVNKKLEHEREDSNKLYAIKLVEKIVFALVSILTVGVVAAWLKLLLENKEVIIK